MKTTHQILDGIEKLTVKGTELLLGKLFFEIGFSKIKDELFRQLVIARLCYPTSKLGTTDYLYKYQNIQNVTTLYFEVDNEDELRKTGFSKEGKHQHPQIVLGLLVSVDGYPLAYEIFEGNKFEGYTMLPVIETFKNKYKPDKLVIIADSGLLSNENVTELQTKGYEYILGARIKNEKQDIKSKILELKLANGESEIIQKDGATRLIVSFSEARARKDEANNRD